MSPADEFIESVLAHQFVETNYDPAKRHEQYLRTRELKGRTTSAKPAPTRTTTRTSTKPAPNKAKAAPKPSIAEMEKHVEELKTKLAALREVLAELVAKAKARSGVEEPSDSPKSSGAGGTKTTHTKKTEQQKAEDAKKAKEYYEKNKDKILSDQVKELGDKLKVVAEKIRDLRAKLAASDKKSPPIANRPVGVGQTKIRKG